MTKIIYGVAAVIGLLVVACATEEDEKTGSTDDALSMACLQRAKTPADFQACLNENDPPSTPPTPPPSTGGGSSSGSNSSCQSSVQCSNGVCKCGSGPRAGQSCIKDLCQTFCRSCN